MTRLTAKDMARLLKRVREMQGMSKSDLSRKTSRPISTIDRIEKQGVHGIDVVGELFDAMGVDVEIYVKQRGVNDD